MADIAEPSVGSKLKEAGQHSVIYGLGSVAQSAVGFVLLPLLTGSLSKDAYGAYSLILMAGTVASAVFYLGMTSAMPRSYYDYESDDDRRAVFTTAFLVLAMGALAQIALGYWGGGLISSLLLRSDGYAVPVAWAFFASALAFINQYFFAYLRFLRKSLISVLYSLISLIGGIGLTVFLLKNDPGSIASPFEAIAVTQLVIAITFVATFGKTAFTLRLKTRELTKLVPFGIASILASFATMLLDWSDRLIIERYVSLADVGVYSAGYRLGSLINVIMILPFAQIWSPMMLEYRNHENIKALFTRISYYYVMIGAVILVGASLFTGDILPLLVRFRIDDLLISVVLMVMLGYLAYGLTNIVSAGLFYERKLSMLVYIYYAMAGVKIGANLLIVPAFGIAGAAGTTLVVYMLVPAAIYLAASRYFSFSIEWKKISVLAGICALPFIYGMFLWSRLPIWFPWRIAWFLLECVLIYLTCLSMEEKSQIRNMLSSSKGWFLRRMELTD